MSSIFSQLFRYRPSGGRLSREDFFTEAFAGVLKKNHPLRIAFVKWLICQEVDRVDVETQWSIGDGGRPDIRIEASYGLSGAHHVVAMENKIDSEEGPDQLRRYEKELRRYDAAATRTLVYATLHEQSDFQCSPEKPQVVFRQIHWFRVADWLRSWTANASKGTDNPNSFVCELVSLMEEWNMAMNLNIDDLAAATVYQTSVAPQLRQILDDVWAAFNIPGTRGNQWSYNPLWYSSPWIDDENTIYVKFGFDFDRNDADWSVEDLRLPSAYVSVRGTHRHELDNLTNGWRQPPDGWHPDNLRVKHLNSLQLPGDPLHLQYLSFFESARAELWQAVGIAP